MPKSKDRVQSGSDTPRPPVVDRDKHELDTNSQEGGKSRNKGGRPKGSKNRTTLLREAIQNDFTRLAKHRSRKIFEKLTECAMEGEPWAVKLFMDKLMPNAGNEGDQMLKGGVTVNISIEDMKPRETIDIEDGEIIE